MARIRETHDVEISIDNARRAVSVIDASAPLQLTNDPANPGGLAGTKLKYKLGRDPLHVSMTIGGADGDAFKVTVTLDPDTPSEASQSKKGTLSGDIGVREYEFALAQF
jgi:hypothetical protein